jgi:hypothetical protein
VTERLWAIAEVWAYLAPIWLLTLAALVWGHSVLAKEEVRKGLAWTLGASVVAFPVVWAAFSYLAGSNPQPKLSATVVGGRVAAMLFPVYSALLACAAFAFRIEAARKRGAPKRPLIVRAVSGLFLLLVTLLALGAFGVACLMAVGPKPFG